MSPVERGHVGIVPAGALGVAFYHHLAAQKKGRVSFLERAGSASGAALRGGVLEIAGRRVEVPWRSDLEQGLEAGWLPEIVLVCTQPDQLLGMMKTIVHLLEMLLARGGAGDPVVDLPTFILTSNGIYFQRVRQYFGEALEEAMMFGRLPDLWESGCMPRIVGKLLRGVTIQTGQRDGHGAAAHYRPGPRGRTRLAGGEASVRARAVEVLGSLGGWFDESAAPATRVEFDKALINLCANLLGQLHAIDEAGNFRLLTVREILAEEGRAETRELAGHVIAVGQAVRAYGAGEDFEALYEEMLSNARQHLDHIPSSLQWIEQQLRRGVLEPRLTPTERWLLEPLIRYAHGAGLEAAAHYFEHLTRRLEHRLALAARRSSRR